MNRKSLIYCFAALAVMMVGIGVAVAFLYSGSGSSKAGSTQVADENRYLLLPAVPSDAVAVFCSSDAEDSYAGAFSAKLQDAAGDSRIVMSLHHSGKTLVPLYIIDAGRTSDQLSEVGQAVVKVAQEDGMYADTLACSSIQGIRKNLSSRTLVVVSANENLVKSSVRHLRSGESVIDAAGFAEVSEAVTGDDVIFLADTYSQKLISAMMAKGYSKHSSFFSRFAEWTAFSVDGDMSFAGVSSCDKGQTDFMAVLDASGPETSSLSSVLPSYVLFAASLPMNDADAYVSAYKSFVDSKQQLASYQNRQRELAGSYGVTIDDLMKAVELKEVATASFKVAGGMQKVNLMRVSKDALPMICPEAASKSYEPAVHPYRFPGLSAAVFGSLFSIEDEAYCTVADGWVISGSKDAVDEYVQNGALEYSLADKLADAGENDLLAQEPSVFVSYFSFTEDKDALAGIFSRDFLSFINSQTEGYDYCPFVLRAVKGKKQTELHAQLVRTEVKRSKAPVAERDTTVVIPEGPYEVKNCGSGKMNKFYQNSHLSLCLSEDGKDLWGIPFQHRICGVAKTIDYYANGKLQILFGAGSKIYLIDRLGRFVNGFPIDLGKEILLGPEPYDFNGVHRYNVMVLHKDKTLEMYNLKGHKPDSWKGIRTKETIKALPELISVGQKSYWVVRTSVQTLIYPLMGGEPLTVYEGDKMIRPDSEIKVTGDASVSFECYDGQQRTLKF